MKSTITMAALQRALNHVTGELSATGLLTRRLYDVPVVLQSFSIVPFLVNYYGLYVEETTVLDRLVGLEPRTIYVPSIALPRLLVALRGGKSGENYTLRDILRHELGHAFAVEHPGLVRRNTAFTRAFGARYDDELTLDEDDCVSAYAATSPCEDFAETFMTYVRVRGDIDRFKRSRAVHRKLGFVKGLVREVARRGLAA